MPCLDICNINWQIKSTCFYLVKTLSDKIKKNHIFILIFSLTSASFKSWKLLKQETTFHFGIKDNEHTSWKLIFLSKDEFFPHKRLIIKKSLELQCFSTMSLPPIAPVA